MRQFYQRVCKRVQARLYYRLRLLLLTLAFFCFSNKESRAAVTVSGGSGGTNICSNRAVGGSSPSFVTLSTITITEGLNTDISGAPGGVTNTIVLSAPTGWQFGSTLPTFTYTTGANVTAVTGSITSTTLTINITANSTTAGDQVFVSGLQVQATATTSAGGFIYPSSASGVAGLSVGPSGTNFASLSLSAPVVPSVTLAASPAGAVCPGVAVTFSPTPSNGGTSPIYQWYVNGSNVSTGSTYTNSSLANGNTVSCVMATSLSCVTAPSATSNTVTMTVNAAPAAISGYAYACPGTSTTFSSTTGGGAWSSSAAGVANVNSAGQVTGVSPGTARITYTAGGCPVNKIVYINAAPTTPALSPTASVVCNGGIVAITAAGTPASTNILTQNFNSSVAPWTVDTAGSIGLLPGAEWKQCGDGYINEQGLYHSPDNTAFAMSNSDTSGSASYTASKLISPSFSLSGYSAATLSFQHAYEAWIAGDYNVDLEISTNGGTSWNLLRSYTGTGAGTKTSFAADTFSLNAYLGYSNVKIRFNYYCHWGYYWAVDNVVITGVPSMVIPTWSPVTALYTDTLLTTPYVAGTQVNKVFASPSAPVTTTAITYTATATIPGCATSATSAVTVNPVPGAIGGSLNTCTSTTTTLTNTSPGGLWNSSNTGVATINSSSGIAMGLVAGTTTISYTSGAGCTATAVLTVNTTPAAISGPNGVCFSYTATYTDASVGGTWSSSNTTVATIGSSSGIVNGLALGTATLTYSLGAGCSVYRTITVNPLPASITGTAMVCQTLSTSLASTTTGGTWTSNNTAVAAVGASNGVVSGTGGGNAIITYTSNLGCYVTRQVTVNPQASITGTLSVCVNSNTTLSNVNGGGTWSTTTSLAMTDPATGVVTGAGAGTALITYTLPTGCTSTAVLTINALPASITGTAYVCEAANTTLADATVGGTWTSNNITVAGIGSSSGIVSGYVAGTAGITYTLNTGCSATTTVTVNPLPPAITGTAAVCVTSTTTLANAAGSGTWSSISGSVTVGSASGIVAGLSAGTVNNITYTLPTGCFTTRNVTVNSLPAPITGSTTVCQGLVTTNSSLTPGGGFSANNGNVSITASGAITGITAGTTVLSYTLTTGCYVTRNFTVNPLPDAIAGPLTVCAGQQVTVTNTIGGGSWTSSNGNISIGSASGVVTGVNAGTSVITYTLPTSCLMTRLITVNPLPADITGASGVCVGAYASLASTTTGGVWSSSNTAAGTINTSGQLYGIATGTTIVSYTLGTGCRVVDTVTVNPLPASISGATSVCLGLSTTLTDATGGGSWISSNAFAGVGSANGVVTGYTVGTSIISYVLPTGCYAVSPIVVNSLPLSITGPSNVCVGFNVLQGNATAGGTWSSTNTTVATVGSSSGIVNGGAVGTTTVSYTLPTGCAASRTVTVFATPAAISGPNIVCQGSAITLSDATAGGSWASGSGGIASVGSSNGVVIGLSPGTSNISYILGTCPAVATITVYAAPGAISGPASLCQGATGTLSNSVPGGSWISTSSVALIGSASGIVTAMSAGTAVISYVLPTGCYTTTIFTANPNPAAISGPSSICVGASASLTSATTGGSWMSTSASVAAIGSSSGFAIAYSTGNTLISYTLSTGCATAMVLSVNNTPGAIAGAAGVCEGATITMSCSPAGGTWTSGNTTLATIGSASGIVNGLVAGNVGISYTLGGCSVGRTISVSASPSAITGGTSICYGVNTTLSTTTTGGTWSSGSPTIAGVASGSGIVAAFSPGTATISYTVGSGCYATAVVVVNTVSPITGPAAVCTGITHTLTNASPGGTWVSSNSAVLSIDPATGAATGNAAGSAGVTYTQTTGCKAVATIVVNPSPAAIAGTNHACPTFSSALSNSTWGGTWSTSNPSVAAVNASGVAVGVGAGTATISYTLPTGCYATIVFTTDAPPPAIGGSLNACQGNSSLLTNTIGGGAWTSSNTSVATIGSSSGLLIGYTLGTTNVTYTTSAGCHTSSVVTVNPVPAPITGIANVCQGLTTTLADVTSGGNWSSGNITIATVNPSGVVQGMNGGVAVIYYTLPTGCAATRIVTVNTLPSSISGSGSVCVGSGTSLSNSTPGGTWGSNNIAVATVGSLSGVVNGLVAGTAIITYTPVSGCITTQVVTVNPLPSPISGPGSVCTSASITLTSSAGGTWSSSNPAVATAGTSTGIISGVTAGTATITFTAGLGCWVTASVNVNPSPAPIGGSASICAGSAATLSNTTGGGTWTSSNTSVATIGSNSGIVAASATGTTTVSYILGTGCSAKVVVSVNPVPAAITGITTICNGASTTLSNTVTGGTWSSSNTATGTVGSTSGAVRGLMAGSTTISYTLPAGCFVTANIIVNPLPSAINGSLDICPGFTSSLSGTPAGGTWASGNTAMGTIGATSGVLGGVSAGTTTVTYTLPTGCSITTIANVNTLYPITGSSAVCVGQTTTLANAMGPGTWASSDASVATVGLSGAVTGNAAGTSIITFTYTAGCKATRVVTVNSTPTAIAGTTTLCAGTSAILSNAVTGGTWTSSALGIAVISLSTGELTGVAHGTATITYTLGSGCQATTMVSVSQAPAVITGTPTLCQSLYTNLYNSTPGGTWTSNNTSVATINTSGMVTGVNAGTASISYTLANGCLAATVVTVSSLAPITGSNGVCLGSISTLSNSAGGGVWTSSNPSVAAIGATDGIVSGNTVGVASITYAYGVGCWVAIPVSVNPVPAGITGPPAVCEGSTITMSDITAGGSWTASGGGSVVNIDIATGALNGVAAGNSVITYTLPTGCFRSRAVSVNPLPGTLTGAMLVCANGTTTLSSSPAGGTWISSTPSAAVVDFNTGVVAGIAAGSAAITYTLPTGCAASTLVSVHPLPASITGALAVCETSTTTLASGSAGGVWSASGAATVAPATGIVSGVSAGTALISYTLPTSCAVTAVVSINPLPAAITGPSAVCVNSGIVLSNITTGGVWATPSPGTLSVASTTGDVTGITAGTGTVNYILPTGCKTSAILTVHPLPSAITGTLAVCAGSSVTLANSTTGGSWSAAGPVVGVMPATGVVTGYTSGSVPVTYTLPTGCYRIAMVTVHPLPAAIDGAISVCAGSSITLSNSTTGGTWSSGIPGIATVGSANGVVAGIAAGTVNLTYTSAQGCVAVKTLTVNPTPGSITGIAAACEGASRILGNAMAGGVWSSSNTSVATIDAAGSVSTLVAGYSPISYTMPTGCSAGVQFTVNSLPSPITGTYTVCAGSATGLSSTPLGGNWTSSSPVATIGSSSGTVQGISAGTTDITYTLSTGCTASRTVSVYPVPAAITGTSSVCQGYATTLNSATPGGTWTAIITGVATVGSASGVVNGINAGSTYISYTLSTGCAATAVYTVHPLAPITGPGSACLGQTTNLGNLFGGGSWTSGNIMVATVGSASGTVYGLNLGATTITYTMSTGCYSVKSITVNPVPAPITGAGAICMGSTLTMGNTTPGGMWSTSDTGAAPISSSGIVSGHGPGVAAIIYVLSTGCGVSVNVTVNALYAITGSSTVCANSTTTLSNAAPGGAWTSTTGTVATINAGTGVVSGVAPGTTVISYLLSTGCLATRIFTVNTLPSVYSVTGGGSICVGGPGVPIGLNSSSPAVNYHLYNGSALVGTFPGTSGILSFGTFNTPGTYSVNAVNSSNGCARSMAGTAIVTLSPYSVPSVSVTVAGGDSVCPGSPATFLPVPVFGGSAPTYSWRVNGVLTGVGGSYSYTPATGDVVSVKMTSNATCIVPDTASASLNVVFATPAVPSVSTIVAPGDTVCAGTSVTITPLPVNGGALPVYNWFINGLGAGTGAMYSFTPFNGDRVFCTMISSAQCVSTVSATSGTDTFTVIPHTTTTVSLSATPGFYITSGTMVTVNAITAGAPAASYQWYLNGTLIPGATNSAYVTAAFLNGDSVSCVVAPSGACPGSLAEAHAFVTVKQRVNSVGELNTDPGTFSITPNPNSGAFVLSGGFASDIGEFNIQVYDATGRVVYSNVVKSSVHRGVRESLQLPSAISPGIYLLRISSGPNSAVLRFSVQR